MGLPTYTDFDLNWSVKFAAYAKWSLYGIGERSSIWALTLEWMFEDAENYADQCVSNLVICNS